MKEFLNKWGMTIVIVLLLLIAFFVVFSFFKTRGQRGGDEYREKVELLERERNAIVKEREALEDLARQKDQTILALNRVDSLLQKNIESNNRTLHEIQKQRETLNRIDKFNSDQLRKYFSDLR